MGEIRVRWGESNKGLKDYHVIGASDIQGEPERARTVHLGEGEIWRDLAYVYKYLKRE